MKKLLIFSLVAATSFVAAPALAQGIGHTLMMRGQVVDMTDNVATLCIGKADGAQVGQVLDVARAVAVSPPPKSTGPAFRREDVGHIKITNIVDDHFATASVVSGSVAKHDIVELRRK